VARFTIVALYTGTRKQAILGLRKTPSLASGWVDIDHPSLGSRRPIHERQLP
jgi:hypothetical protein